MRIFYIIILLNLFSVTTNAQWTQTNGPEGGRIYSFASDGTNIFAGTYEGGVFLSTNNGDSWSSVSSGITSLNIYSLAISGANIFAGTSSAGVFLSTNNGASWTPVNNGITDNTIHALIVNGANIFAGTNLGVFMSSNNGTSWSAVNNGMTDDDVRAFAVSGTTLYAGTYMGGMFKSVNNGTSWTQINTGLTDTHVRELVVSGSNIFLGTESSGIFLSTNGGASWTAVNNGLTNDDIRSLAVSGSNIFAGTDDGLYLSGNNGASWSVINTGLTNTDINSLLPIGTNIFAGTNGGGVFLSSNNGIIWTPKNTGLINTEVYSIAISGTNIFAGTNGGVFLTNNNGNLWTAVNNGLTNTNVRAIAINGTDIFAGTTGTNGGMFLSTNNGTSWTAVNNGLTNTNVRAIAISGTNIFAGTGGGVFLSTNNGTSWTAVNNGLTNTNVQTIAISGTNIYVGTIDNIFSPSGYGGVYLSTNNGSSWTELNNGLTNNYIRSLAVNGSNVFAGAYLSSNVYLSTDNGTSWSTQSNGLTGSGINALAISGTSVFAGTYDGIFLSTNSGGSWLPVIEGLTQTYIQSLAIGGTTVFTGTYGGGVFINPCLLPIPQAAISPSSATTFCQGNSVTLNASGTGNYTWSPSTGLNTTSGETVIASPSYSTSYILTSTTVNGCSTTDTITITVNAKPTVTISGELSICVSGNTLLTADAWPGSGTITGYQWAFNGSNIINATSSTFTATAAGSYTVTVTNSNGCTTISAPVTVIAVSTAPNQSGVISGDPSICQYAEQTYSISPVAGASSYTWTLPSGWSGSSDSTSITAYSGSAGGTISVTANNSCGSGTAQTLAATINAVPTATITPSGPTTFCDGYSVTLTSSPAVSYLWSNGATTQNISVSSYGSYNVQVTDANGCINYSTYTSVSVNPPPAATITAEGPTTFCPGGNVTLTAANTYLNLAAITFTATGSNWCGDVEEVSCGSSPDLYFRFANGYSASTSGSGSNSLTSTWSGLSLLAANRPVTLSFYDEDFISSDDYLGTDTFLLSSAGTYSIVSLRNGIQEGTGTITVNAIVDNNYTYLWSNGATTRSINTSIPGNYTVTVTNGSGCYTTSAAMVVSVNSFPTPTISHGSTSICTGDSVTLTSSAGDFFLWSNGATTQSITVSSQGNYSVTVSDSCASATSSPVTVSLYSLPSAVVTASGATTFCEGGSVILTAAAGNSYLWSNGATTQSITVTASGNYSVTVTNNNACSATSTPTVVTVNPFPTATITASGPTTFCSGSSVTLTAASAGNSYLWSNGSTTQSITATASGDYSVTVTNSNGCSTPSAATSVTVYPEVPVPVIENSYDTLCTGAGLFSVGIADYDSIYNYSWAGNGLVYDSYYPEIAFYSFNQPGEFSIELNAEQNGCVSTGYYPIHVSSDLAPQSYIALFGYSSLVCMYDDADSYEWGYNDLEDFTQHLTGITTRYYDVADLDTTTKIYWVKVTDNGCTSIIYYNSYLLGIEDVSTSQLLIYPNPAHDFVTVECKEKIAEISISDISGKIISDEKFIPSEKIKLQLSDVSAGMYILKVQTTEHNSYTLKIIMGK